MRRMMKFLVIAGLTLFLVPHFASALTIGFSPAAQTVELGGAVSVDIVVSDLGDEIVSAYDLDVTYDASILSATGVTFGFFLGDESWWEVFNDSDTSVPGVVDLAQLSLLPDAELALMQPDSFTLATLEFQMIAAETSSLNFTFDAFNDIKGLNAAVLDVDAGSGSVSAIPEPGAALVFGLGVLITQAAITARKLPGEAS